MSNQSGSQNESEDGKLVIDPIEFSASLAIAHTPFTVRGRRFSLGLLLWEYIGRTPTAQPVVQSGPQLE